LGRRGAVWAELVWPRRSKQIAAIVNRHLLVMETTLQEDHRNPTGK
jgi:hypothetical protein